MQLNQTELLILAPMEGVMDYAMRELLTSINHFDLCITEFVRVVDNLVPRHVFKRIAPELLNAGLTINGTKVRIQLLGQEPDWIAENAVRAIELGSHGIDLNFGCPAKTVNKRKGGAVLLDTPELIHNIVKKTRAALPNHQPLSVKIRLGYNDMSHFDEVVDGIVNAGANLLTIHARTKRDGYKPPAYWQHIGPISEKYHIPIVANGEIWQATDAIHCRQQAKTPHLMIGRGVLSIPNLANVIRYNHQPIQWSNVIKLLDKYGKQQLDSDKKFYYASRIKQWLVHLSRQYPEATQLFNEIKTLNDREHIAQLLKKSP
jgi:tRNA-dihydrouridine synthase C